MSGALAATGFVLIWASAFNAARAVALEWPPLWGIGLRFAFVAPLLGLVWWWRRAPVPSRADRGRLALMGLFGTGGYLGCAWLASAHIPSGLVAVLSATTPLFVALGRRIGGDRVAPLAWAGLALGWAGVALLGVSRSLDGLQSAEAWGFVLALLGALSQAVGLLCFAPARARVDPWTANFGQAAVAAAALMLAAALAGGPPPATLTPSVAAAMLWSCLVVGVLGYVLFFEVMRRFPPATSASLQLLAPPVAALIGWALLGERLGLGEVVGGLVTLAGLALIFRAR